MHIKYSHRPSRAPAAVVISICDLRQQAIKATNYSRQRPRENHSLFEGTSRLINVICDNALLIAYGASKRKVSAEIIEEVASDLALSARSQHERPATTRG
jgi:hypothetical protein